MSKNNVNTKASFNFRANAFKNNFATDVSEHVIKEIYGWGIWNATLEEESEDAMFFEDPGIYLSVSFLEGKHISIIIPEEELLNMLVEVQKLKNGGKNYYAKRTV